MASISISGWSGSSGRTFTLTVTEQSYNAAANTSNVKWTLSVSGGNNQSMDSYIYCSVNGSQVYNQAIKATYDGGYSWSGFPANVGSTSGEIKDISHNADGTKSISFYIEGYAVQYSVKSASGTLALTNIDRSAPTVTQAAISDIGTNSFMISASSNVNCNSWEYSLNNGSSWTVFSSTNGTSASTTVTGLTVNTSYTVIIRAKKTSNDVYGTSGSQTAKTTGASTITSATNITLGNYCSVKWTPYDAAFVFTHKFSIGSWSSTTTYIRPNQTTAYTYTGKLLDTSIANEIPSATAGLMTVELKTYKEIRQDVFQLIGSPSLATFNVTVPSSVVPTITSVTLQEGTASGFGLYVKTLSTVKATVVAAGALSSTITSIMVKVGSDSYAANSSGVATSKILQTTGSV